MIIHRWELYSAIVQCSDMEKYSKYTYNSKGIYYPSIYHTVNKTFDYYPKRLYNKQPTTKEHCVYYYKNNELLMVEINHNDTTGYLCWFIVNLNGKSYAVSAEPSEISSRATVCEEIYCENGLSQYFSMDTSLSAVMDYNDKTGYFSNASDLSAEFYSYGKNGKPEFVDYFNSFPKPVGNGRRFAFVYDEQGKPKGFSNTKVDDAQFPNIVTFGEIYRYCEENGLV